MSSYAVYNPATNKVRTWVTEPRGDLPDGWEFREASLVPADASTEVVESPPAPVPDEVPMWAFRRALERVGMLNPVLAFIATLPHELRRDAETHLEYGNFIRRDHPLMAAAAQLGLDSDKVDDIFRVAHELTDGVADFGAVAVNPGSEERKLWERVTDWVSRLFGGA